MDQIVSMDPMDPMDPIRVSHDSIRLSHDSLDHLSSSSYRLDCSNNNRNDLHDHENNSMQFVRNTQSRNKVDQNTSSTTIIGIGDTNIDADVDVDGSIQHSIKQRHSVNQLGNTNTSNINAPNTSNSNSKSKN
eukprot:CAMPEP_0116991188 /NCGR_PEP_ID=MMETSP0467-20121206/65979_1 /TAXON_ID=283647 /ORGANISM="Mesodinium pulex, Strain SPMC105" /LENGTH=132 /DNA_ID=CAMNT_0004688203 /DNA_START=222 /DNA_END=620 /DNA_ORIENTATION=+